MVLEKVGVWENHDQNRWLRIVAHDWIHEKEPAMVLCKSHGEYSLFVKWA